MKVQSRQISIAVTVTESLQIYPQEAAFLREMAKHCVATNMAGHAACSRLIEALDAANVPPYHGGPVYGIFERKADGG